MKKISYTALAGLLALSMPVSSVVMASNIDVTDVATQENTGDTKDTKSVVVEDEKALNVMSLDNTNDANDSIPTGARKMTVSMLSISEKSDVKADSVGTIDFAFTSRSGEYSWDNYSGGIVCTTNVDDVSVSVKNAKPADETQVFLGIYKELPDGTATYMDAAHLQDVDFFELTDGMTLTVIFGDEGQTFVPPVAETQATVKFDTRGGDVVLSQIVEKGTEITLPVAIREGYTFLGWFDAVEGGNKLTKLTVDKDVTVYAQWKADVLEVVSHTITFDTQGGSEIKAITSNDGSFVKLTGDSLVPTKDGYTFLGWFDAAENGNAVDSVTVDKDVTVYAQWGKAVPKQYAIAFDYCTGAISMTKYETGVKVEFPAETPTREGYKFKGWFDAKTDGTAYTEYTVADKDVTFYAQYEKNAETPVAKDVILTFDTQGGSKVSNMVGKEGVTVILPNTTSTVPTKDGYSFVGWFDAAEGGNKLTDVKLTADMTIYAQWEKASDEVVAKNVTLTFDTQGGSTIAAITGKEGVTVILPSKTDAIPTKAGYTFKGWYTAAEGGNKLTDVKLTENVTVYAQWTKNSESETDAKATNLILNIRKNGEEKVLTWDDSVTIKTTLKELAQNLISYGKVDNIDKTKTDVVNTWEFSVKVNGSVNETKVQSANTAQDIIDLMNKQQSQVLVIARDANGELIGSALVSPNKAENTYDVTLYDTADVTILKLADVDSSASDNSAVSSTGKNDSVATAVQTGDINMIGVFGAFTAALASLLGAMAALRKRRFE